MFLKLFLIYVPIILHTLTDFTLDKRVDLLNECLLINPMPCVRMKPICPPVNTLPKTVIVLPPGLEVNEFMYNAMLPHLSLHNPTKWPKVLLFATTCGNLKTSHGGLLGRTVTPMLVVLVAGTTVPTKHLRPLYSPLLLILPHLLTKVPTLLEPQSLL